MGKTHCLVAAVMTGLAGLGGCSKTPTEAPSAATPADSSTSVALRPTTKEPITLRGIPFDQGDVRQKIVEMCISDATRSGRSEAAVRADRYWCTFDRNRMRMLAFQYGNLGGITTSSELLVDDGGTLLRFEASATKPEMLVLATALEAKYGKPLVKESEVSNRVGTKFSKKTFVWTDDPGTTITVESMYERIDEGRVTIESRSYQTAQAMREKIARQLDKSKL